MKEMIQEQIDFQEKLNTGTSWTRNPDFERDGYLVLRDLINPQILYRPVPEERGQINYWGTKMDQFVHHPVEQQVEGSLACYWHPQYRESHTLIRLRLEEVIGRKLYNTYYYDRFYFVGQDLKNHADRDACEISVSIHISSNLEEPWPLWIKSVSGENRSVNLRTGDGMLYKGCERPHWRDPLQSRLKPQSRWDKLWRKKRVDDTYYHQVFFHYVLADGQRSHCAFDRAG